MQNNKGFWRGFTFKRMFIAFLIFFFSQLLFALIFDYPRWQQFFTSKELIRLFLTSLLAGFFISLWHEPEPDKRKKDQA